jgi:hypothetical protein
MKDIIDMAFMDLFNVEYLFEDYAKSGTAKPIAAPAKSEEKTKKVDDMKEMVNGMNSTDAAVILSCGREVENFDKQLAVLTRMHFEEDFRNEVVAKFNPPYKV